MNWQGFAKVLASSPLGQAWLEEVEMAKSQKPRESKDSKQDKALVRQGVGQHESAMHKGKAKTKLKLGKQA